jgi:hypothetical protein
MQGRCQGLMLDLEEEMQRGCKVGRMVLDES